MGFTAGSAANRTYTERNIYVGLDGGPPGFLPGGGVIDATYAIDGKNGIYTGELRPGTPMARITTSKLWVPCKRTRVNGAASASDTIAVDDSRAFKVGDTITVNATGSLTITAIDYDNDELTLDGDVTAADNAVVFGSGALAGSETARCILDEFIDLYDQDARANVDRTFGRGVVKAKLLSTMILGDYASIVAATNFLDEIDWYADGVQV